MATLTLLALGFFAGLACSSPSARITEGTESSVAKWPSIVQVDFLGTSTGIWLQSCGGNILTSRYVISAAHCFHGIFYQPKNRRIRAGSSIRNTGGMVVSVDVEFNHPSYGRNDMDGDISVVRLLEPLVYSDVIKQGPIIPQGYILPETLPVVIAGWGPTERGSLPSNVLQEATIIIGNKEACIKKYSSLPVPRQVTDNMICGDAFGSGKDACQEDLGGPMYFGDILVGVLSFSEVCGDSSFPVVSTAISSYTEWIIATAV